MISSAPNVMLIIGQSILPMGILQSYLIIGLFLETFNVCILMSGCQNQYEFGCEDKKFELLLIDFLQDI